eukprot:TRINITY_DN27410_c0_g1_i1.p1 TRINITY_DN27410_c0_g1~~TRINITY_DN27410_c0_g1_i1.p1  ORF type:complete len:166 (-),score=8.84 TRINITY_DN27410_c0_g1_i1:50-490(-)
MKGGNAVGGTNENSGSVFLYVIKSKTSAGDYSVILGGDLTSIEAGTPTTVEIYKAATNTVAFTFSGGTWSDTTRRRVAPWKKPQYTYQYEGEIEKASAAAGAEGSLKDLIGKILDHPRGYYAVISTSKRATGIVKGYFWGFKRLRG